MSESIAQSYQECDERTGSIQSVWVTRWVGSGQNSTSQGFRTPNNPFESKKKSDGVELQSAGEFRNIGSQTRQVVNQSFRAFSGNFRVESTHHSATMSMVSRNDLPLRDCQEARECLSFKPPNDPNTTSATAISSGKNYSESEASLPNPIRRVKPHSFFRHSHTVASVPTVGNCIESVSHIVPYRFGYGKLKDDPTLTEMPLLVDRVSKSHLPNSTLRVLGDKHNHESEMESGRQSLKVNGDWFQKLQNGSRLAEFQNNYASLEATEPSKALNNICMSEELPHSLHDMKTMRICTTVDSVVGLKGCFPRFSQTTHSLLIVNESDVNICKQNQTVGTSRACNEFNKRIFSGLDKLPSALSQKQQGVKLRLLDSCTDSELEEDVGVVEPSDVDAKNESSAETDAMDFDASTGKTHLLGVSSSSLFKKECERGQKLCHVTPMEGVRSDGIKKNKTPPNNIVNSYTSGIPAEASSSDNLELSSNTHSLDMESFIIAHDDQNNNSKPALFQSDLPGSDPSSRFVKRLKLSNLYNMALGTRSLNTKEDSSHECKKQHTRFHGKACSEPTSNKNKGKEWMVQDKRTTRNNVGESSSAAENLKSCRDKLTSYPWIQRLLRDRATKSLQIPEVVGGYEPGSAGLEAEQIQKRHFPSIAAMALMGKGMKGFQPCQFQNKGSFVVWN